MQQRYLATEGRGFLRCIRFPGPSLPKLLNLKPGRPLHPRGGGYVPKLRLRRKPTISLGECCQVSRFGPGTKGNINAAHESHR